MPRKDEKWQRASFIREIIIINDGKTSKEGLYNAKEKR